MESSLSPGKKKIRWVSILPIYLMVLPGFIYLLVNNYIPMYGVLIAFKRLNYQKGIFGSDWCGFDNFRFLFGTQDAWVIMRNTILYNVAFFIVGTVFAIAMAILLNEIRNRHAAKVYQSLTLLPYIMSWVVVSYLVYAFLSADKGLVNTSILQPLGKDPVNWYQDTTPWPYLLIFVNVWKTIGYTMIIYLSSIVGISKDYYEAAELDGASKWQQIKSITLPLLKPTVITLLILSVGQIFRSDFGLFYQVPRDSGMLYPATQTLDVYIYHALMKNSDFGLSSAASVYQSIVGFILIMTVNHFVKKYDRENALF